MSEVLLTAVITLAFLFPPSRAAEQMSQPVEPFSNLSLCLEHSYFLSFP
jgi:hypothetical protein